MTKNRIEKFMPNFYCAKRLLEGSPTWDTVREIVERQIIRSPGERDLQNMRFRGSARIADPAVRIAHLHCHSSSWRTRSRRSRSGKGDGSSCHRFRWNSRSVDQNRGIREKRVAAERHIEVRGQRR